NVGLFLILPTSNLGQKYIISAYNDQHSRMSDDGGGFGGWSPAAFPPTGGGFILVGVEDNTVATIKVTGPTTGGRKRGDTWQVSLNKGETYYVRGAAESEDDDLSRSTVNATKPLAVFAGCEIARTLDAMVLQDHFDYNDYIVEQMIPIEIWGTEYVSGPMTNKRGTKEDDLWGDFYRIYAAEPTELFMNGQSRGISDYWEFGLEVVPRIFTAKKPIMVVQYDYYIDFHGINPKNPRTSNNEMVLVPRHNWRKNATFTVPTGYEETYFHVVAHRDSIDKIRVSLNGGTTWNPVGGMKYTGAQTYNVGNYRIYTLILGRRGQVIVDGPCDFAVYNYGTRDNDYIKATYSYASAAAASFGSINKALPPRMVLDSTCTEFNMKFYNTTSDARGFGLGEIYLLENGMSYKGTKYYSKNMRLEVTDYGNGADTVFARMTVKDPLLDAEGYLYVANRAGKDTVYTFRYSGAHVSVNPTITKMENITVFEQECRVYTFKNDSKASVDLTAVSFMRQRRGQSTPFTATADLPKTLGPGETMDVTVCFIPPDTGVVYWDSLSLETRCFTADIAHVEGIGRVPTIYAMDHDYDVVVVGQTVCHDLDITNKSYHKPLILTTDILKSSSPEFQIDPSELARFPITLAPRAHTTIKICYTPVDEGRDSAYIVWGRDIPEPYSEKNEMEWTILWGRAQQAGVAITSDDNQEICATASAMDVTVRNSGTALAWINKIEILGPDQAEFKVASIQGVLNWNQTPAFDIAAGDNKAVRVDFTATDPNPWRVHNAILVVTQLNGEADTSFLSVDMRRPVATSDALINLGTTGEGQPLKGKITVNNTGNYDFVVKSFGFKTPGVFTVVSGIAIGDVIAPGASRVIDISATSATAGSYADQFEVTGETCGLTTTDVAAVFEKYEVRAQGADIPATWTCQTNGGYEISFTNNSTNPVELRGVTMMGTTPQQLRITFLQPAVGLLRDNDHSIAFTGGSTMVAARETITFPVSFDAQEVGAVNVPVQFLYTDHEKNPQTLDVNVTAIGKNYPVDLAITGNAYRGTNDVELEVPITVSQTNLYDAEVYGYQFDVTFNEDNFKIRDVQQGNGHLTPTYTEVGKTTVNNVDFVTIRVRAHGSRIENDENILARMILQTRLTTENTTTLVPTNFSFLDQAGDPVCWTPKTEAGNEYTYDPLCGDGVIQQYLANGAGFLQSSRIAPNPANEVSNFEFDLLADAPITVGIFDALGNQVSTVVSEKSFKKGHHSVQLDVRELSSGTYFVRTSAGESWVASLRLTVQK
ncbi:MAG TPA: T9SS type A sorting domain-containing protein, partial [Candidatus Kapabacteria bacterium]|nr:T9SS type A sorting domain-containing protein [Candidatus Kapabacteria bacterium]